MFKERRLLFLGIEVGFELFFSDVRLHTVFWHINFGDPEDSVEDNFTEIVIGPIVVDVGAAETEAASAVLTFGGPGDMDGFAFGDDAAHSGIAFMRTVVAIGGAGSGNGCEDWGNTFHGVTEAHVEIPFVFDGERFYAARDRMFGKLLEIGDPVRIY
jgi:hypothetical protein